MEMCTYVYWWYVCGNELLHLFTRVSVHGKLDDKYAHRKVYI